ncbi:MAG: CGNR zinc finger domain-containing protein [Nocardioidaceae bacterium]|nr:CGNR zinc finger domain-containing protein [Nocardioidaceae bacterium]
MTFAHDTQNALTAAAILVNSAQQPETMTTVDELDDFFHELGYTGRHDRDDKELAQVRASRTRLRALLTADRNEAVVLVNQILGQTKAMPQLVRHDDWDWHLHVVSPDAPLATRITVETAMAMIDLIRADELSRLSLCEADGCEGIVVDLSRNRSRRFCSTACGNRTAVAAYRARKAAGADGG